jgi:hypothetical protein
MRAVDTTARLGDAVGETRAWIAWLAHGLPDEGDTVEPAARAALARAGRPRRLHVALELALARRAGGDGDLARGRELYGASLGLLGDAPADRLDAARGLAGLTEVAFRAGSDDRGELLERANAALDRAYGPTHPTPAHLRITIAAAAAAAGDNAVADALRLRAEAALAAARGRQLNARRARKVGGSQQVPGDILESSRRVSTGARQHFGELAPRGGAGVRGRDSGGRSARITGGGGVTQVPWRVDREARAGLRTQRGPARGCERGDCASVTA